MRKSLYRRRDVICTEEGVLIWDISVQEEA